MKNLFKRNYIVEGGIGGNMSWESCTCLNTTLKDIKDHYGEQCSVVKIGKRDIETISKQEYNKDEHGKYIDNMRMKIKEILEYKKKKQAKKQEIIDSVKRILHIDVFKGV